MRKEGSLSVRAQAHDGIVFTWDRLARAEYLKAVSGLEGAIPAQTRVVRLFPNEAPPFADDHAKVSWLGAGASVPT